jgi:YbgC/YbaW family acyl-CoA thioester hydrolase
VSAYDTSVHVRFGDCDAAAIAYFPRLYGYLHEVFEELWERHVGVRYADLILGRRLGFPLVHSEVDFRSPLRFGDTAAVRVTCFRLGRSSLGLRYVFSSAGRTCFDARQVTSCVELGTLARRELPAEFRPRFEAIAEIEERA